MIAKKTAQVIARARVQPRPPCHNFGRFTLKGIGTVDTGVSAIIFDMLGPEGIGTWARVIRSGTILSISDGLADHHNRP
jgi:hypothetical protein